MRDKKEARGTRDELTAKSTMRQKRRWGQKMKTPGWLTELVCGYVKISIADAGRTFGQQSSEFLF
ncbi:hypothetical protein [Hymenobacter psoromatis]|uniref:hypothetical protein n=1 Tax=Hymenobacter psoromatis TaxID=1484116 RepID=UPI001CBEE0E1|nr:hypothetical protein [Hymenobacter psoromatis]